MWMVLVVVCSVGVVFVVVLVFGVGLDFWLVFG